MIEFNLDKRTDLAPAVGRLLIAEPFMPDGRFFRTVILIANHDEDGTLGFILNQKPDYCPNILNADTNEPLFSKESLAHHLSIGGPISEHDFFVLHDQPSLLGGHKMTNELYLGLSKYNQTDQEFLDEYIQHKQPDALYKLFLGSSGWSVGQLEEELEAGSWFVAEYNKELIFSTDFETMWKRGIYSLGEEFSYFASLPLHPQLN